MQSSGFKIVYIFLGSCNLLLSCAQFCWVLLAIVKPNFLVVFRFPAPLSFYLHFGHYYCFFVAFSC